MSRAAELIRNEARKEIARRSLLHFCQRMMPQFDAAPHLVYLASLLEQVESGQLKRLVCSAFPRSGKSNLVAMMFPAWYLGRDPSRRIITASSSLVLAARNNRVTKSLIESPLFPFPECKISKVLSGTEDFETTVGFPEPGGSYAVGVLGTVSGKGADLLLLDDVVHDEGSPAERQSTWEWLTEIAYPRLNASGAIAGINTRWAMDDVYARILAGADAPQWAAIELPAWCTSPDTDPLGRKLGQLLWPDRWTREALEAQRVAMGSRSFSAQYLCQPSPPGGSIFQATWFERRFDPNQFLDYDRVVIALDPAASTSATADNSAIVVAGNVGAHYYVFDVLAGRWGYVRMREILTQTFERYEFLFRDRLTPVVRVEATSNGLAAYDELKSTCPDMPIEKIAAVANKVARAEAVSPLWESGSVALPQGATWIPEFVDEMTAFSGLSTSHDDRVDAQSLALSFLRNAQRNLCGIRVMGGEVVDNSWAAKQKYQPPGDGQMIW